MGAALVKAEKKKRGRMMADSMVGRFKDEKAESIRLTFVRARMWRDNGEGDLFLRTVSGE